MDIRGFIETSFLDWDGKVSSVIFLPNCNYKCPFCGNSRLVNEPETLEAVDFAKIESFLLQRRDFIDGVVITGGEPTLHPKLTDLIRKIKSLDLLVKLDTNGTDPEKLKDLIDHKLVDYIAMDIKAPLGASYDQTVGVEADLEKIRQSLKLIMASGLEYEFRTTVVPTLHEEKEVEEIAKIISGAKKYVLQQFVPDLCPNEALRKLPPYPKEKILGFVKIAQKYVPNTIARGV